MLEVENEFSATKDAKGIYIEKMSFNDGTVVSLHKNSIVLITGANNCGKSQLLRDVSQSNSKKIIANKISFGYNGDFEETLKSFAENFFPRHDKEEIEDFMGRWKGSVDEFFESFEDKYFPVPYLISQALIKVVTTSNRIEGINVLDDEGDRRQIESFKAIHESKMLERKIHDIVKNTFGTGFIVNRDSFNDSSFRFIDIDKLEERSDKGEPSFARWLELQPALEAQGDGVRSFCTVIISVLTDLRPLIVIDEPEAFLHPPQIRQLARTIALEAPPNTQILIATHSNDFVQGLLDFADNRVSVLRLIRYTEGDIEKNLVKRLDPIEISTFWKDPLLKTSDALTSLFHDVAVIVEGDSDARFFQAMLDATYSERDRRLPNMRFFHCGGKDRVAKIASALRSAGVPVVCVVDIDILDDKSKFCRLYESIGGDRSDVGEDAADILSYVASQRSSQNASDAKIQIDEIFSSIEPKKPISKEKIEELNAVLQTSSAWRYIKRNGSTFFAGGNIYNKFNSIREKSIKKGLIINQHGELENYCRSISPRKDQWLSEVLQKDLLNDPDLYQARLATQELVDICRLSVDTFVADALKERAGIIL